MAAEGLNVLALIIVACLNLFLFAIRTTEKIGMTGAKVDGEMIESGCATLYINGKNCGRIESFDAEIEFNPLPSPSFVLDNIEAFGKMTIISSPFFERMINYRIFKELCNKEAKRAVLDYKERLSLNDQL